MSTSANPKVKTTPSSVLTALEALKKNEIRNIYLLFGPDHYLIQSFLSKLTEKVQPEILSDFDNETYFGSIHTCADVFSSALAYPFGGGKKLIIYKEFEQTAAADRERLLKYIAAPSSDTIMVILYDGDKKDFDKGVLKKAVDAGVVYEAKEQYANHLTPWIIDYVESKGKQISKSDAQLMQEITGSDKILLENQLEKMITFAKDATVITSEMVKMLSDATKEYSIFDLYNALGKKNKPLAFKITTGMLNRGDSILPSLTMLFRYFFNLAKIPELQKSVLSNDIIARKIGTASFFLGDYIAASRLYSKADLYRIMDALHRTELAVKTTAVDEKTLFIVLITEILQ